MWKKFLKALHFLYLLVKALLCKRRNYFWTQTLQSFPTLTPRDLIIQLQLQKMQKKESDSNLKYAALVTSTQEHSYKQVCGIGVARVACLRAESE